MSYALLACSHEQRDSSIERFPEFGYLNFALALLFGLTFFLFSIFGFLRFGLNIPNRAM